MDNGVAWLKKNNLPLTRKNWLRNVSFFVAAAGVLTAGAAFFGL